MNLRLLLTASFAAALWTSTAQAAPPPMMDPSAMSGIPRPDPKLAPGTVTVRCLGKAGFSAPAVDTDVTLEVTGPDGTKTSFTAKTQAQGRATFDGLSELIGGTAVASVTLGGAEVKSGSIALLPQTGTAVMLVEGASAPAAAPPAAAGPRAGGEPAIPPPGNAFPLDGMAVGTLTVGTFDLEARKPVANIEVKLTITPPEGESIVRTLTTDARGKAVFEALSAPDVPEGSTLSVEAMLVEGGTLRKSQPFSMSTDKGMALVLAEGAEQFQTPPANQQPPAKAKRQRLPPPRILRTLKNGSVKVHLFDAADQPIAGQNVIVVKKAATGAVEKFRAVTGADGTALVEDIPVKQDSLYFVESLYGGAPYQSSFFGMDSRGGIDIAMRLFETTKDRSVVRSAVQYDIVEGENDLAQIVQIFEVMVDGDKAFWDPELRIESTPGAKGFTVLRPAEEFLDHEEKAPFATLHGPIPPGQVTNLSVGYLMEHGGTVDLEWEAPFDLVQVSVLEDDRLELVSDDKAPATHESPIPGREVWALGQVGRGGTVSFSMTNLRHRDPLMKQIAWGSLGAFGLITVFGLMMKRPSKKEQLQARRERLLQEIRGVKGETARTDALLSELDRVVRQLEILDGSPGR